MSHSTSTDDTIAADDKYAWTKASNMSLGDFLNKYKPSMVQNDGTKPWIWAKGSDITKKDAHEVDAQKEAQEILKEVTEKVKEIQEDSSLPTRSNKKAGIRSKKELREEVQTEATSKLKDIAIKHGYVSGKWLMFVPLDRVDILWAKIATSLISGPLSTTVAWLAKVATSPQNETSNYQHLINVYIPNVYDKEAVVEVMKVLLRNHGVALSGVKSDLYTALGIDSKHPSGIPSTVWKNTTLLPEAEIKALRDEFFANLSVANKTDTSTVAPVGDNNLNDGELSNKNTDTQNAGPKGKGKPKPKLKKGKDDPFASDDDDQQKEAEKERKQVLKNKKAAGDSKRGKVASDGDQEEEEPKLKKARTSRQ